MCWYKIVVYLVYLVQRWGENTCYKVNVKSSFFWGRSVCSRYSRRQSFRNQVLLFFFVVVVFIVKCFKFLCEKAHVNA